MNTIYRVWYDSPSGEYIVYIGRTKNDLTQRLRQHFMTHPFQRTLDIYGVVRIDYAEFKTVADMYVAEIILINEHKPPLNVDDKAKDELTLPISIPRIEWLEWDKPDLMAKWKGDSRCKR